jgi:dihydroflavonol-4-reductase
VLDAARTLGVTKFVHVSSAATLSPSLENADDARLPGDGEGTLDLRRFRGHYKASKAMAEALALREAAQGLPVVIVQPTTVIGPGDRRPTPSGSMIVHYLNGHMKVYVEMRQNVVDVRDVARGVALALERGRPGARYVLGGDNLPMRAVLEILAELTGIPAPRIPLPLSLLHAGGVVNELIADRVTHRMPTVCREQGLHARDSRYFSSEQARRELGYEARPAGAALAAAVRFFATEGHCGPEAARRILRQPQLEESIPGP